MSTLTAAKLAAQVNDYLPIPGRPNQVVLNHASKFAGLVEMTVSGKLLRKQLANSVDLNTGERGCRLTANNGKYTRIANDGDLHFCLGTANDAVHIACEIQMASDELIARFNDAVDQGITDIKVTGFFRCLFEHSGISQGQNSDCHIFEIHPVRAVTIGGQTFPFDVDMPQDGTHSWDTLSTYDAGISVTAQADTLTFAGMRSDARGGDVNYVNVPGKVSNVRTEPGEDGIVRFTFTSPDIDNPIEGLCLPHTSAAREIQQVGGGKVTLGALRNINIEEALKGNYVINLLAISFA